MTTGVIYVRVSKDVEGSRSLDDQERDCRALAAQRGIEVRKLYREKAGTSAYREEVRRPEFGRMLDELEPGTVVIAWSLDRMSRRGAEQAGPVLRQLAEVGASLVTVSDGIDTARDESELNWSIRAALAKDESFKTSQRTRRGLASRRALGLHHGRAPYGLRKVEGKLQIDPDRIEIAREIADKMLAGESAYAVSKWLNEAEIRTKAGGVWQPSTVVKLVTSPSFAGYTPIYTRRRSGKYADRAELFLLDGEPVSVGEGVVSLTEWRKISALIAGRTRATATGASGRRGYTTMLGGVARCGLCGGPMVGTGTGADGGAKSYGCSKRIRQVTTCAGVYASRAHVDFHVGEVFLNRLAASEPGEDPLLDTVADLWTRRADPEGVAAAERAREALSGAESALERLDDDRADGLLDRDAYARQRQRLAERRDAALRALRDLPKPAADISPLLDPEVMRPAWEAADTAYRRELLTLAVESVRVSPVIEGVKRGVFDPRRVEIEWRA